ncbi:MAG: hypothetical protein KIT73_18900, partial [Burkholderiales bacterium]|nr:hypothetical protein [Burkholderiales bacterium]
PALLDREMARFPGWLVWLALISPRLELHAAQIEPLGVDSWRIRVVLRNAGWLPTYVTQQAKKNGLVRGVIVELEAPEGVSVQTGERRADVGQLEGRAYKPTVPSSWAGWGGDVTDDRVKVEWIVRAVAGSRVMIIARHDRAGVVRVPVLLRATVKE